MSNMYIVQKGDTLPLIADRFQISPETLVRLNNLSELDLRPGQILRIQDKPTTRKHVVRPGESLYVIAKSYGLTVEQLKQLNRPVSSNLRTGQELIISTNDEENPFKKPALHTVRAGDTPLLLAKEYEVDVRGLIVQNELDSNRLSPGMRIKIPQEELEDYPENILYDYCHYSEEEETLLSLSKDYQVPLSGLQKKNPLGTGTLKPHTPVQIYCEAEEEDLSDLSGDIVHTVKEGENLYSIARVYGISLNRIRHINKLPSDTIELGQSLLIQKPKPEAEEKEDHRPSEKPTPETLEPKEQTSEAIENIPESFPSPLYELADSFRDKPLQIKSYIEARKVFRLDARPEPDLMQHLLKGPLGRNHVNRPDDLARVQKRLVQLKLLGLNHKESPDEIKSQHGGTAITSNLIPRTIEAIEKFQEKFEVQFWISHSNRVNMMQTNSFTPGVIVPGDITHKLLMEYTDYTLVFPHPQNHRPHSIQFHNFPHTVDTCYYRGVIYPGNAQPEIPLSVFQRLGLSEKLAQAMRYISQQRQSFDYLASHDPHFFSFGFVPFRGNQGALSYLMANIKHKAPQIFQNFFERFGIDVSYSFHEDHVRDTSMSVVNAYDKGGKFVVHGAEAERVLRADPQLYGPFIRSGHYLPIITLQIDAAIKYYVQAALNMHLHIIVGVMNLPRIPITDLLASPMGYALLIDMYMDYRQGRTREILREAIEKVAIKEHLYSEEDLMEIDERKIILQIIADARMRGDERVSQKATSLLYSGLTWKKN